MSNSDRNEARRRALAALEAMTDEEDAAVTAAAEADPDNPPLTDDDFARMKPARGRPRGDVEKVPVTIRLDADVVEAFKVTGRGWQTRMNETLRIALAEDRNMPTQWVDLSSSGLETISTGEPITMLMERLFTEQPTQIVFFGFDDEMTPHEAAEALWTDGSGRQKRSSEVDVRRPALRLWECLKDVEGGTAAQIRSMLEPLTK